MSGELSLDFWGDVEYDGIVKYYFEYMERRVLPNGYENF